MLPELVDLKKTIKRAMQCGPRTKSRLKWTRYIVKVVDARKPPGLGLVSRPKYGSGRRRSGEYLADLTWSWRTGQGRGEAAHGGLALALECEWHGGEAELWNDFVKLADLRADRKIFVGAVWHYLWREREKLLDRCRAFFRRHRHVRKGERLLVVLCDKSGEEEHEGWIIKRT